MTRICTAFFWLFAASVMFVLILMLREVLREVLR